MPTSYTNLLGLALPVQGELVGTWGDEVNNYITSYIDAAVAGTQTISGSQTAVTLSKTTGATLSQAGAGATGSSQYQIINCTGNPAGLLTITAPAASKVYLVLNNTSTSQSVKIVGAGPTTGITVATGQCALVAWNGTDFELVASTDLTTLSGVLPVSKGGTGVSTLTGIIKGNGASAFSAAVAGTDYVTPTGTETLTNKTLSVDSNTVSGIAASSFVLSNASGNIDGAAVQKAIPTGDVVGTTDTQTLTNKTLTTPTISSPTISDGTANGVAYLNGSKVLTTGSALTFDGTNFATTGTLSGSRLISTSTLADGSTPHLDTSASAYGIVGGSNSMGYKATSQHIFNVNSTEQMRLTSTGLGIGTSSPGAKLHVDGGSIAPTSGSVARFDTSATTAYSSGGFVGGQLRLNYGNATNSYGGINFSNFGATSQEFFGVVQNSGGQGSFVWQGFNGLGYTERMRLDSSGNLGLGVTPSAWFSNRKAFDLGGAMSVVTGANITAFGNNYYTDASAVDRYVSTGSAAQIMLFPQAGGVQWFTAPSGTAGNAISFTQAMTLDASGNLGVGTTSPTAATTRALQVTGTNGSTVRVTGASSVTGFDLTQGGGGDSYLWNRDNNFLAFGTNNTERARIDSSGNLIQTVNTTAATLTTNQTLTFSIVDNSTLRISVRGSDGTTRTATIALS